MLNLINNILFYGSVLLCVSAIISILLVMKEAYGIYRHKGKNKKHSSTENECMIIGDSEIGGVELKFSVEFNVKDKRTYIEIVSELQDEIADIIENLGHNFVSGTGKPIKK